MCGTNIARAVRQRIELEAIEDGVSTLVLGVPKYDAGSGGPLRVLALR